MTFLHTYISSTIKQWNLEEFNNSLLSQKYYPNFILGDQNNTQLKIINLIKDYLITRSLREELLSIQEMRILSNSEDTIEFSNEIPLQNQYGFSLLDLAIIADKEQIATNIIQEDPSFSEINSENILDLIKQKNTASQENWLIKLFPIIIDHNIHNKDVLFQNGRTLLNYIFSYLDFLQFNLECKNFNITCDLEMGISEKEISYIDKLTQDLPALINESSDPLLYFFKNDSDPFHPTARLNKIHIAVSQENPFIPDTILEALRLVTQQHPNVEFNIVTLNLVKEHGDNFLKQFDGFINPGSPDSFPKEMSKFNNNDCPHNMELEQLYQLIVAKSYELEVPYMGICGGAQHLALYHQGFLGPVSGYMKYHNHTVTYKKGSLSSFFAMTEEQKEKLFSKCEIPTIEFIVSTYNNYAAIPDDLGQEMRLEAVSEDGTAMAYSHENGIRYGVQFHPEAYYYKSLKKPSIPHYTPQKALFDNFVELAILEHEFRFNNGIHPTTYIKQVSDKIEECIAIHHNSLSGELTIE